MSFQGDWVFNTDESEEAGRNAYLRMMQQSCVAAWGKNYGAQKMLAGPRSGHRVFFYRDEVGIIGMATFTHEPPFPSNSVFGIQAESEFHRRVVNLKVVPSERAMSWASIVELTKYYLPVHGAALHRLRNSGAVSIIAERFEKL